MQKKHERGKEDKAPKATKKAVSLKAKDGAPAPNATAPTPSATLDKIAAANKLFFIFQKKKNASF